MLLKKQLGEGREVRSRASLTYHSINGRACRVKTGSNRGLHSTVISFLWLDAKIMVL